MQEEFKIQDGILYDYKGEGGDVVIPEGVTEIWQSTFVLCETLERITIPKSVKKIGRNAFPVGLREIRVAEGNENFFVENNCLLRTRGDALLFCCDPAHLPASIASIGPWAFAGDNRLVSFEIPRGVKTIGGHAFSLCDNLVSVTIPEGVTSIGSWAFSCCAKLKELKLPKSVTRLGSMALMGCDSLETLTVPKELSSPLFGVGLGPVHIIWF